MLSLAMTAIAAYYAISRLYLWRAESQLIEHGQQVHAEVMGANPEADAPPNQVYSPDVAVDLKYTWNGQTYRHHGVLGGRKEQILSRTQIPIFIDPANPSRWTARTQPGSLTQEMLSAMLLVPFAVVLFAMALWRRWLVLSIYRDGEGVLAEVIGVSHSAAAPLSRLLRCAVHVGNDARVIKILLPARIAPGVGGLVWLIAPPGRAEQAIPAGLFE
jgi:hypothetical protein